MLKKDFVNVLAPLWRKANPHLSDADCVAHLFGWSVQQLEQYYNTQVKLGNITPPAKVSSELTKLEEQTIQAVAELAAERTIRQLRDNQAEQQRKKEGREVFTAYAKQSGVSDCVANFELAWKALAGENFDKYSIEKAVRDGLQLAPATVEEISRRTLQAIQNHQDWMKNHATQSELREHAAIQSEFARERAQQAFLSQQLAIRTEREAYMQFPVLPDSMTRENIMRTSGEEMRKLVRRYGFSRINDRIHGRG